MNTHYWILSFLLHKNFVIFTLKVSLQNIKYHPESKECVEVNLFFKMCFKGALCLKYLVLFPPLYDAFDFASGKQICLSKWESIYNHNDGLVLYFPQMMAL